MIIALPSILRAADSIRLSPNGGGTRCCLCCCCWWCSSSARAVLQLAVGEGEKPSDSAVIKIGFCAQLNHIFAFNWRLDSRVLTWLRSATAILLPSTLCDFFFLSPSLSVRLSLCSTLLSLWCLAKIYDYIEIWWFIRDRGQKTTLYVQEPSKKERDRARERQRQRDTAPPRVCEDLRKKINLRFHRKSNYVVVVVVQAWKTRLLHLLASATARRFATNKVLFKLRLRFGN